MANIKIRPKSIDIYCIKKNTTYKIMFVIVALHVNKFI